MTLPPIITPDGRRAYAFLAVLGACFVMTAFAAVAVWLVRGDTRYSFYLGLAAHAQLAIGLGVFGAQFVKRTIKVGTDGLQISDDTIRDGDTLTVSKEPGA